MALDPVTEIIIICFLPSLLNDLHMVVLFFFFLPYLQINFIQDLVDVFYFFDGATMLRCNFRQKQYYYNIELYLCKNLAS